MVGKELSRHCTHGKERWEVKYFCEVSKGDEFVEGSFFMHTSANYFFSFRFFYYKKLSDGNGVVIGERAKRARHSQVYKIENRGYIMVRAISVYSAGVPYAARYTAAVKIPLPLAMFQF